MARYAVGIDIGGTKIYAGIVDLESGAVLSSVRKRTHPERGADYLTDRILDTTASAIESAKIDRAALIGIGAGITGQIDRREGVLITSPNLGKGLDHVPIRKLLFDRFKLPVVLGNDVEIGAMGEQTFGAGQGCDDYVCVFVGTGIGGAIVRGGTIRQGATGTAGEIGHMIIQYGGRLCGCGGCGHLEAYASRTAITHVLLAEMRRGRVTKLSDEIGSDATIIRSKALARAADAGDGLVTETLLEAADYLGAGLGSIASFYNPARIILGGGLIEAVDIFFQRAALRAHEAALPISGRALEIVRSALGDNAGIIGAAVMAASAI